MVILATKQVGVQVQKAVYKMLDFCPNVVINNFHI